MKKIFRRLACCAVLGMACIGCFDVKARVTKEVAEAVLPYLMEAAGITEDTRPTPDPTPNVPYYIQAKRDAIISMIYTDEGQQQMVEWVQTGRFPQKLSDAGLVSVGTYADEPYRKVSLASLFPCQTGTFTSFANHDSRLGKHLLSTDNAGKVSILKKIFFKNFDVESILTNLNYMHVHAVDSIIAKIVFVLEICDETATIANLAFPTTKEVEEFIKKMKKESLSNSEYLCRPVSAIVAKNTSETYEGDCTETLYKHLINIAIQDKEDYSKFHIGKIPERLRQYYSSNAKTIELKGTTYAGETSIVRHDQWKELLSLFLKEKVLANYNVQAVGHLDSMMSTKITPVVDFSHQGRQSLERFLSTGKIQNIAAILTSIANSSENGSTLSTSIIEKALNCLSSSENKKFKVAHSQKTDKKYPWMTDQIIITEEISEDKKRTIIVGTCEDEGNTNLGHAEIISITIH